MEQMTLKQTLSQHYDAMALSFFEMVDNLVVAADDWAIDNSMQIDAFQEVLTFLKRKLP
uniref:Uncharacterized protein n=1 Tax=uncultured marine virus TaxID=186617 RepID=A0A0F7L5E9_9VIRU|nr:hypothetical protein [uncultured marine virus]